MILVLTITYGWHIHQIDVYNVFLNRKLKEEVYLTQPRGFIDLDKPNYVCNWSRPCMD